MCHSQQRVWCESIKKMHPEYFKDTVVLEAGSLDVNGNNRYLFNNCFYIGVDLDYGKNVDLCSKIEDLKFRDDFFDMVITTELLEHDPSYYLTLNNCIRMLRSGGLFILTCASTGRGEHGTLRSRKNESPNTCKIPIWANYYKNLTEEDIRFCLNIEELFSEFKFGTCDETHDLYFYGVKK